MVRTKSKKKEYFVYGGSWYKRTEHTSGISLPIHWWKKWDEGEWERIPTSSRLVLDKALKQMKE